MSIVTLVSGGLDSTLMTLLAQEEGVKQHPLFIDYGQIAAKSELDACKNVFERLSLPTPIIVPIEGFGSIIRSGLTDKELDTSESAFTPGRNLLFLLIAAAYAMQEDAESVAIGLLNPADHLFPDQVPEFIASAEATLRQTMGRRIEILTPLFHMSKADIISLAKIKGISGTYSCHEGNKVPCGICIACREFDLKGR